jgi:hypothetical protein
VKRKGNGLALKGGERGKTSTSLHFSPSLSLPLIRAWLSNDINTEVFCKKAISEMI